MDAEQLLRRLGATGKLKGFYQAVYMIEQVRDNPAAAALRPPKILCNRRTSTV